MMYFKIIFILFVLVSISPVYSDRGFIDEKNCVTDFNENKTILTLYGDSLGDFVDQPLYGVLGWETYLGMHRSSVEWDIQNFATAGATTRTVYDLLKRCAETFKDPNDPTADPETIRKNFKTADNVAFEIGGNDYMRNSLLFIYAPWRGPDIVNRVTNNQQIIMKMLKLRNKRVLVMGNFPTLSKSPSMGNWPEYFRAFKHPMNRQLLQKQQNLKQKEKEESEAVLETMFKLMEPELTFYVELHGWLTNDILKSDIPLIGYKVPGCGDWYRCWLRDNYKNPLSHAMSILMFMGQPALAEKTRQEGLEFLDLYAFFIRHSDCTAWGQCWVANPDLFDDFIHINQYGYFLWSAHLAARIDQLQWANTLPNVNSIITGPVVDPPAPEVEVGGSLLDLAIIFCLWTRSCGK